MRTALKITGISLGALALLGGMLFAAANTLDTTKTRETTISQSVHKVVIKADAGDIDLVRGGHAVEIRETKSYVFDSPHVRQTVENGVLTIEGECDGVLAIVCDTDFRIEVPAGVEIDARTYVGDLEIDGITADGIEARGYVGDIQIDAGRTADVKARTNVGDVDITVPRSRDQAKHPVDADSDVGTVDVTAR
jgi:hypothetical protein